MTMLSFQLGIAIVGAGAGFTIGERLVAFHRAAPLLCALTGGVIFYLAAFYLVTALSVIGLAFFIWLVVRQWLTVHQAILAFAESAGFRFGEMTRTFRRDVQRLQRDHDNRIAAIQELGLGPDDEEEMLEKEDSRYREQINRHVQGH